jgi:hypothetical protein
MRTTSLRIVVSAAALAIGAGGAPGPAAGRPAPLRTGTFNRMQYVNTNGRVGYHMISTIRVNSDDTPNGNWAECNPAKGGVLSVAGDLPPGLIFEQSDGSSFSGTPRQPGDWTVRVTIPVMGCRGGPDQAAYGPRIIEANFHIAP